MWQHFYGIEIETKDNIDDYSQFDWGSVGLMELSLPTQLGVHFFYVLPFERNKALIETTWISKGGDKALMSYQSEIENYLQSNLRIKKENYKIVYKEQGAIPLFHPIYKEEKNPKLINGESIENEESLANSECLKEFELVYKNLKNNYAK